jgi:Big-like domain-containing protein/IPT/TIG domain-containing protein
MDWRVWRGPTALLALLAAACGGGGEGTGPAKVAAVTVSANPSTIRIGENAQLTTSVTDSKGTALFGRTVTYSSSNIAIATVTSAGSVTGVAAGSVTITATVEGKSGTANVTVIPVPVAAIILAPRDTILRIGQAATIRGTPVDGGINPLPGRTVTWASSDQAKATVSAAGVVTAVAPGTVYIRATSETITDSARVLVPNPNAPSITTVAPATMVAGATATITGKNFGAAAIDNTVLVNGVVAAVTAATGTSITFTLPPATSLPCSPTGPVPVNVVVAGDTATFQHPMSMATQRTLAVGQALLLSDPVAISCNELPKTGGRYLFTTFHYEPSSVTTTSFRVVGDAGPATSPAIAPVAAAVSPSAAGPASPIRIDRALLDEMRASRTAHDLARQLDADFLQTHHHPLQAMRRFRQAGGASLSRAAAPLPSVNDMVTFRMRRTFGNFTNFDNVRFRAVYVGSKIVMFEDSLAPLARTMDATFQAMGQEFDDTMFPILENFGDPLAYDSQTDANGRIIAIFSTRVNAYSSGLLGFVTSCDFFPNVGTPDQTCPSSNMGEFFYASAVDPSRTGFARDIDTWRSNMRGTLIHEAKHITANAERFARDADFLEEAWLEESTAQIASEIWSRVHYSRPWKGDVAWADGPRCDFAAFNGACGDNAVAILHHFQWLYQFYDGNERRTPITTADGSVYGSGWSLVRWATDVYGGADERTFLRSLVQQRIDRGIQNLEARTGKAFVELLGRWSLATLVDDTPGFNPTDATLSIPSWNTRDIFAGMNRDLRFSDGSVAFPRAFPLRVHSFAFGTFPPADNVVNSLPGGSFAAYEVQGTQAGTQTIGIRNTLGGLVTAKVGLAIVRVN